MSKALVGYDCLGNNGNAVDLTRCYHDFKPQMKYSLLDRGYETVPWILQSQFETAGGEIHCEHALTHFDHVKLSDGTSGVELHFQGDREPVRARAIVLAMPRHAMELLRQVGPDRPCARPHTLAALSPAAGSVMPIALYKIFVGYNFPWWETAGVTQGRSFTEMSARQCYYWA